MLLTPNLRRQCCAELLGTGLLVIAVVGSGIAATRLSDDVAVQLLANSIATGGALYALIVAFAAVSGAQFNPAVGALSSLRGTQSWSTTGCFALSQVVGACIGAVLANIMFGLDAVAVSHRDRSDWRLVVSEVVATIGLLVVITGAAEGGRVASIPAVVAGWITGAYWFTSSTSFANPAVTVGRALSDSFAGIALSSVPWFVGGQAVGVVLAFGIVRVFRPIEAQVAE